MFGSFTNTNLHYTTPLSTVRLHPTRYTIDRYSSSDDKWSSYWLLHTCFVKHNSCTLPWGRMLSLVASDFAQVVNVNSTRQTHARPFQVLLYHYFTCSQTPGIKIQVFAQLRHAARQSMSLPFQQTISTCHQRFFSNMSDSFPWLRPHWFQCTLLKCRGTQV